MKNSLFLYLCFLFTGFVFAQDNPYAKYGYEPKFATFSNGKFNEFHDRDTIVQIGRVIYNTMSKTIVGFVEKDTTKSEATLAPDIVSRWLSPDPLAHMRLWVSPYNFVQNNPIMRIDPDGRLDGWVEDANGTVSWDENTNSQAEFDKNYAGMEGFKYVSASNDASLYNLPDGSGSLKMHQWGTAVEHKELTPDYYNWELDIEFIPSDKSAKGGWLQTVHSNGGIPINYGNAAVPSAYDKDATPFIDLIYETDPTKSKYTSTENRFSDILGRVSLESRNLSMIWKAETSYISNENINTVTWGLYISPSGDPKFFNPTISNTRSKFHNTAIENLPR